MLEAKPTTLAWVRYHGFLGKTSGPYRDIVEDSKRLSYDVGEAKYSSKRVVGIDIVDHDLEKGREEVDGNAHLHL